MSSEIKKIGITGATGFIGLHLSNHLNLFYQKYILVPFSRYYFQDENLLDNFVQNCDIIIHLAALNRHTDPETIYRTNIELVNKLINSFQRTNSKPHVIFSSSSQEELNNLYGLSKKEGREKLSSWAEKCGAIFTGLIIPNVFGPFGDPYYNSVIATFSYQLAHNQPSKIEIDAEVKLIYIDDLICEFISAIENDKNIVVQVVAPRISIRVSDLLIRLETFKNSYQENGQIPLLASTFDLQLFNTYRCYIDLSNYFPRKYNQHKDSRGTFIELIRSENKGQNSFSTTNQGVTRGNHFHTRKIERFSVIRGTALIKLRRLGSDKIFEFILDGNEPSYVDMPIWHTHNITNIGEDILYTSFWINEPYNPEDPDTYLENV